MAGSSGPPDLDDESRAYLRKFGYASWQKWLAGGRHGLSAPELDAGTRSTPSLASYEDDPASTTSQAASLTPWSAVATCYRRYVDFEGRASRAEFWWFAGWVFGGFFVSASLGGALYDPLVAGSEWVSSIPMYAWSLAHAVPLLAVQARRLHDWGRSGWWLLLHLVGIGSLVLWLMMLPGTVAVANRWGSPGDRGQRRGQAGSILRATLLATLVLGGSWFVLLVVAYLMEVAFSLRENHGIDSGWVVFPALALWPLAVVFGVRAQRLQGVSAYVGTGLATIFLTVLLWAALIFVLILIVTAQ